MKRLTLCSMLAILAAVAIALLSPSVRKVAAQTIASTLQPPPYNPYPPGILPADLTTEIDRVRRETRTIFNQALGEWHALTPPTLTGQPPTLQGTGYSAVQILGKLMNFDENISVLKDEACAFCHMPYAGFSGPIPSVNATMIAYPGSFHFRAGKRSAQRYTYSPSFPVLQYNQQQALFFGGNFWDSRSTGYLLQSPDAEQAQHPPVDTQEMGAPDTACIVYRLSQAVYRPLFELVWGRGSFDINWPGNVELVCSTPGGAAIFNGDTTPLRLSTDDRTRANDAYNHWGQSLSFYEASPAVSAFSSKFDAYLKGAYTLTPDELAGYNLFKGKGNCNSCHLDGRGTTLTAAASPDNSNIADAAPLFTCFGSANLGLPLNPKGRILLPDQARFLRLHSQSVWLRLPRLRPGYVPAKRFRRRPQSEFLLDAICSFRRWPNAGLDGTQCGDDSAPMSHHGSAGTVFPEGVLP